MTNILNNFKQFLSPTKPLQAGIYHYISPPEDARNYRLHLRIEGDANGILIINASTVLHLNQTAAEYAYYLVHNESPDNVARTMSERYNIDQPQAKIDYLDLSNKIQSLLSTPDLDPVTFLDIDRVRPFTGHITAPYRLDCAVTYNLPDSDDPNTAPVERVDQELNTDQWKKVIDKAWQAGIPHILFTGGEPTLREDIAELILHAEMNGQVTGLLTNGLLLGDKKYLDTLLGTGLDHVMLILQSDTETFMTALRNSLDEDIFVAVHLTLTDNNEIELAEKIVLLGNLGVKAISLSAADQALAVSLERLRELVAERQLDLIWNLPVPYSSVNPIDLETDREESLKGEGKAWLYVEPDGDVLPAQGVNRVLGNLLQDEWSTIWEV